MRKLRAVRPVRRGAGMTRRPRRRQDRQDLARCKSAIGTPQAHREVLRGLGLRRIRHEVERAGHAGGARHGRQEFHTWSKCRRRSDEAARALARQGQHAVAEARRPRPRLGPRQDRRARATRARSRAPATAVGPASRAARCRSSAGCRSAASPTIFRVEYAVVNVGAARRLSRARSPRRCWPSAAWCTRGRPVKVLGDGETSQGACTVVGPQVQRSRRAPRSRRPAARCEEPAA